MNAATVKNYFEIAGNNELAVGGFGLPVKI
jgi:hypothetical protein